jgi:hypothetical protein
VLSKVTNANQSRPCQSSLAVSHKANTKHSAQALDNVFRLVVTQLCEDNIKVLFCESSIIDRSEIKCKSILGLRGLLHAVNVTYLHYSISYSHAGILQGVFGAVLALVQSHVYASSQAWQCGSRVLFEEIDHNPIQLSFLLSNIVNLT